MTVICVTVFTVLIIFVLSSVIDRSKNIKSDKFKEEKNYDYPDIEDRERDAIKYLEQGLENIPDVNIWKEVIKEIENEQKED